MLRAKLYAVDQEKRQRELGESRLAQVGTGERAEKIRTYNFPQDRVTDHRIGQNFSNLPGILDGDLDRLIDALTILITPSGLICLAANVLSGLAHRAGNDVMGALSCGGWLWAPAA